MTLPDTSQLCLDTIPKVMWVTTTCAHSNPESGQIFWHPNPRPSDRASLWLDLCEARGGMAVRDISTFQIAHNLVPQFVQRWRVGGGRHSPKILLPMERWLFWSTHMRTHAHTHIPILISQAEISVCNVNLFFQLPLKYGWDKWKGIAIFLYWNWVPTKVSWIYYRGVRGASIWLPKEGGSLHFRGVLNWVPTKVSWI